MHNEVYEHIALTGIVPVLTIRDAAKAVPTARAILAGGIDTVEIAFRTDAAADSIARVVRELPEMLVGAGTVLTVENARQAVKAGAKFIVAPGLNSKVVSWCLENDVPVIPGCATPTEIEAARELGLRRLKFFPATSSGGLEALHDFAGPYTDVCFMTTGGLNSENMNDYLAQKNVYAVGGGWMASASMIDREEYAAITAACREAVRKLHGFSLLHVGINNAGPEQAQQAAQLFSLMFDMPVAEGRSSYFVGSALEVMKCPFLGTNGHIAFLCNSVERAVPYFERKGFAFREEGSSSDERGLICKYFRDEIAGFAIHLRRKD